MRNISKHLFLAVVIMALLLSACGTATTVAPTVAKATTAPDVVQPTAEPTEIQPATISMWAAGRVSEADDPPADWVVYDILEEKLKITLDLVVMKGGNDDMNQKINTAAAANDLPDLFFVNRDAWYALVGQGMIAPVDDLLPLMPTRTATHYSDPNRNRLVTIDGKMYGLPDPGQIPTTDGLVIRKDWLDKLGLAMPKTLDELIEVARAFTNDDPDGNGKNDTYGFGAYPEMAGVPENGLGRRFDYIMGAFGVSGMWNVTQDGFGMNVYNPAFLDALKVVRQINVEGLITPDWPTLKKDDFRANWKQGQWGIMRENFAALSTKSNYKDFDANNPEGEWVVLPPPTGPAGLSSEGLSNQSARIYAISQKAIDEGKGEAIARFLDWTAGDEGYYLLGFGVKGENYNLDANGYITLEGIDPAKAWTAKEMQPYTQLGNFVYIFTDVELKARYPEHQTANGRTIKPLDFLAGFTAQNWTECTASGIINPPDNWGDLQTRYNEGIQAFVLDVDNEITQEAWDAFLADLKGLGTDDWVADARDILTGAGYLK
ncbi:MAG: extracellular solute-binding protein [Anaerolineales bacterium]|nr:extracellular solute-binding protein [Anaerolineales bacterium]